MTGFITMQTGPEGKLKGGIVEVVNGKVEAIVVDHAGLTELQAMPEFKWFTTASPYYGSVCGIKVKPLHP